MGEDVQRSTNDGEDECKSAAGSKDEDTEESIETSAKQSAPLLDQVINSRWVEPPRVNPVRIYEELVESQQKALAQLLGRQAKSAKQAVPGLEKGAVWPKGIEILPKYPAIGMGPAFEAVQRLAEQRTTWLRNHLPTVESMRAQFYPRNLRAIDGLDLEAVEQVVMVDGIPLYGVPRTEIAEALIRAQGMSVRRDILGRRWKAISADCRGAVEACNSEPVTPYLSFAVAALDALDAGHTEAAQALAGSLVDALVNGYFGAERHKYTPNTKTRTNEAYNEFTVRQFIAFAPIWLAYQQFNRAYGDKVPTTFSRHATAHAVGAKQYNRRNAVQGLMMVCSLLWHFDELARSLTEPQKK